MILFPLQGDPVDVRTCFIRFLLSFLAAGDGAVAKDFLDKKSKLPQVFMLVNRWKNPVRVSHMDEYVSRMDQLCNLHCIGLGPPWLARRLVRNRDPRIGHH
jgi:hypothetical protein